MADQVFQIERKRLADQVADQLMALIAEGQLKPGDRLPSELELMKQFQVGRSSIREAIGALSLIGLVTVKPGQGTHVADFSAEGEGNRIGLIGIGQEKISELVESRRELGTRARTYSSHAEKLKLFISDKLLEYIEEGKGSGQPFFAYVAYTTADAPI